MAKQTQYGFFRDAIITNDGAQKVSSTTSPLNISSGKENGVSHLNKFGKNYDIDAGSVPETIWSKTGLYTPPTSPQIHNVSSTSNNDKGILTYSGIITTFLITSTGNIVITDSSATYITDGIASGDKYIDDSCVDHSIIISVDSETQITIQPLHDGCAIGVGNNYRLIQPSSTGAAVLHIFGLDENCDEVNEFLILNGTVSVPTTNNYIRINRVHTDLTGSNNVNIGNIDLIASIDLTSTAYIKAGDGQTLQAFYTVPNGKTAYITNINLSSHRIGTTSNSMISATLRVNKFIPQGQIAIIEDTISVSTVGSSFVQKEYNPYKVFKQRTDIWLQVDYSTDNNMNISGGFDIILLDNKN